MSDFAQEKRRRLVYEAVLEKLTKKDWSNFTLEELIYERDQVISTNSKANRRSREPEEAGSAA